MKRHAKWLRLLLTAAIQGVMSPREPGAPKVLFMLDEFFALGHLEIMETVWALTRGYGVQMMPILQSVEQLEKLYPNLHNTFIGMAGAILSFAPNDLPTAEWISKRGGDTTGFTINYSTGNNFGTGWSPGGSSQNTGRNDGFSSSPVKVPLFPAHRVFGWPEGFALISLDGVSSLVPAYIPAYHEIDQCEARARKNPYYHG